MNLAENVLNQHLLKARKQTDVVKLTKSPEIAEVALKIEIFASRTTESFAPLEKQESSWWSSIKEVINALLRFLHIIRKERSPENQIKNGQQLQKLGKKLADTGQQMIMEAQQHKDRAKTPPASNIVQKKPPTVKSSISNKFDEQTKDKEALVKPEPVGHGNVEAPTSQDNRCKTNDTINP